MVLEFLNNGVPWTAEDRIQKRGLIIATITLISIVASLTITYLVLLFTGYEKQPIIFIIAVLAPLLIAPATTWSIISLMVEIQNLEEAYRLLATNDDLTGLLRRGTFLTQCQWVANLCDRNKQTLAFAILDLDRFKTVNDRYGHGGGDEVLKAFADILRRSIRAGDLAGRLGGEEFALALPGSSLDDAGQVLERIRAETAKCNIRYLHHIIHINVSAGLTCASGNQLHDIDAMIRRADDLLYHAKNRGRNRVESGPLAATQP